MTYTFNFRPRNNPAHKPVSPRQVAFYLDLCSQRKIKPENYHMMTYDELKEKIQHLKSNRPATESQKQTIRETIERLQSYGVQVKQLSESQLSELTGGEDGTASKLIESLFQLERENSQKAPPTEQQVQRIVQMYLCPDVDFESYGIQKKFYLEKLDAYSTHYHTPDLLEKRLWRRYTPDEFAKQIFNKFTRKDASEFITKFNPLFIEWQRTRITPRQIEYIRELEMRLLNTAPNQTIGYEIQNGEIVQVFRPIQKGMMQNPRGYVPLSDEQIIMLSQDEASRYIEQLQLELQDRDLYRYGDNLQVQNYTSYQDYLADMRIMRNNIINSRWDEEKQYGYIEFNIPENYTLEEMRSAKDNTDWAIHEFTALNDFLFALEAKTGLPSDEIHVVPYQDMYTKASASDRFFEDNDKKGAIKEYMAYVLTNDYITYNQMKTMCRNSEVASDLLIEITKDLLNDEYMAKKVLIQD